MPVKAIAIAVAAVITAGIVIYDNREFISEFIDSSRRKLATSLHTLADQVHAEQPHRQSHEAPYAGRQPFDNLQRRSSTRESYEDNEKPYSYQQARSGEAIVTGYDNNDQQGTLRHRGGDFTGQSTLLFDAESEASSYQNEKLIGTAPPSRRSSSATLSAPSLEKPLPPPPPPPAESPFESGYESQPAAPPAGETARAAASSQSASEAGELRVPLQNPFENSQPFWSIEDWAEEASHAQSSSPSLAGSAAEEIDAISDIASVVESVDSWSEVGSDVSGDAH